MAASVSTNQEVVPMSRYIPDSQQSGKTSLEVSSVLLDKTEEDLKGSTDIILAQTP